MRSLKEPPKRSFEISTTNYKVERLKT